MSLLRLLPYIAGLGALIGISAWIYDAGYDARDNEAKIEKIEAVQNAINKAEKQRKIDLLIAKESQKAEIKTKIVYKTIYKESENVKSDCNDIGSDFIRVYRKSIRAAETTTTTE